MSEDKFVTKDEFAKVLHDALTQSNNTNKIDNEFFDDIKELREMLSTFKEMKKNLFVSIIKVLATTIVGALLVGIGVNLGSGGLTK